MTTTRKAPLRAVKADEKAPPKKPLGVTAAAEKGTHRELLVAMRARVAQAVENQNTPARDLAALTRRLHEIARDIEAIDARAEQEAEDGGNVPDEAFDSEAL